MRIPKRRSLAEIAGEAGAVVSRLVNVLFFAGEAHQSLSSRAWLKGHGRPRWARLRETIDRVFFWQAEHCRRAYLLEVWRARRTLRLNRRLPD